MLATVVEDESRPYRALRGPSSFVRLRGGSTSAGHVFGGIGGGELSGEERRKIVLLRKDGVVSSGGHFAWDGVTLFGVVGARAWFIVIVRPTKLCGSTAPCACLVPAGIFPPPPLLPPPPSPLPAAVYLPTPPDVSTRPAMNKDINVSIPPSDVESAAGRKPQNNIVQGTSAAGVRAIGVQLITFYFRAPVKAFFRMRVDYMVLLLRVLKMGRKRD